MITQFEIIFLNFKNQIHLLSLDKRMIFNYSKNAMQKINQFKNTIVCECLSIFNKLSIQYLINQKERFQMFTLINNFKNQNLSADINHLSFSIEILSQEIINFILNKL